MYTCATIELERAKILACTDKDAVSIGSAVDEWVRCQITFTPVSRAVVFTLALVNNEEGSHVYQGEDQSGIDLRPPILGRMPPVEASDPAFDHDSNRTTVPRRAATR